MTVYDFDNRPIEIELPKKEIDQIVVRVLSGDETGEILFSDGEILHFDAATIRIVRYFDAEYNVPKKLVNEWLNWKPNANNDAFALARADWLLERLFETKDRK